MADSDIPAEAQQVGPVIPAEVMAVLRNMNLGYPDVVLGLIAVRVLHAARPLWFAEVDAALRDEVGFLAWHTKTRPHAGTIAETSADYLRDMLGAGGEQ